MTWALRSQTLLRVSRQEPTKVQVTVGGMGERAGNAALEELVAVLRYKSSSYGVESCVRTENVAEVCNWLLHELDAPMARNKAIIGEFAFTTQAGIHQAALIANPLTYEYVEPPTFGRERRIVIGRQSGRAGLRFELQRNGVVVVAATLERLYSEIANTNEIYPSEALVTRYHELDESP